MTSTKLQQLLKSVTVIVDSRENANQHILKYFESNNIPYVVQKQDFGDYSAILKADPDVGIPNDMDFSDLVCIERKNSLNEISVNISAERDRFERELERGKTARFILMVEESEGYEKIITHKYSTQMSEKSFLATLFTFGHRYRLDVNFIDKRFAGMFIYWQLYYFIRNFLKESEAL